MAHVSRHSLLFACALVPLSVAAQAQSVFYITGTSTIDTAHSVAGTAYVGVDSSFSRTDSMGNAYNPTVHLVMGGSVGSELRTYNSSTLTVSGGSIGSNLVGNDSSTLTVSGGTVGGNLFAENSSIVMVSGGSFSSLLDAIGSSRIRVSGGTFGQDHGVNFFDGTTGSFTLVGNNLMATNVGTDPSFGGTDYALTGTLQGGTNLRGYVLNVVNGGTFTLQPAAVPEPGSLALLAGMIVTGGVWVRRRRS